MNSLPPSPSSSNDDHDNWPVSLMTEELFDEDDEDDDSSMDMNFASCGVDVDVEMKPALTEEEELCSYISILQPDDETYYITPSSRKKASDSKSSETEEKSSRVSSETEGKSSRVSSETREKSSSKSSETRLKRTRNQEEIDWADAQAIAKMYGNGEVQKDMKCCSNGCNTIIPKEIAVRYRQSLQEMIKDEKDIVVLSLLASHRRLPALAQAYGSFTKRGVCRLKNKTKTFKRIDNKYYFADLPICRAMFLFLHDMGKSQFENLVKHYDNNGFVPRVHKSQNRRSTRKNVLSAEDIDKVIVFIKHYGEQHGKPVIDRHQRHKIPGIIKLPSDVTKRSVWEEYLKVDGARKMARRTFTQLWSQYCPFVKIMSKPSPILTYRPVNPIQIEEVTDE